MALAGRMHSLSLLRVLGAGEQGRIEGTLGKEKKGEKQGKRAGTCTWLRNSKPPTSGPQLNPSTPSSQLNGAQAPACCAPKPATDAPQLNHSPLPFEPQHYRIAPAPTPAMTAFSA